MNIVLLAVFVTAIHSVTSFQWEFDFRQCAHLHSYHCFVIKEGILTHIGFVDPFHRADYQMHPHVFAMRTQSPTKWLVVMQSRSRKQRVDLNHGMILHRLPENQNEETFLSCHVENGKVVLTSSAYFETELIDSYFDDNHLYCDYFVSVRKGVDKTIADLVSDKEQFALSVSMDGVSQKHIDDFDKKKSSWNYEYGYLHISGSFNEHSHKCDVSQAKYDPKDALTWGKVRPWAVFYDKITCPDQRYVLYVWESDGRKVDKADISCTNGQYEIGSTEYSKGIETRKVEKNQTFNAVCYVEDKNLCPISIPCDREVCPHVDFSKASMEYRVKCEDNLHQILVVGEGEHRFTWSGHRDQCDEEHNLIVKGGDYFYDREYKSPPTNATIGYCVDDGKGRYVPNIDVDDDDWSSD